MPTIHRNGTSAEMLLEGYRGAMEAVRDAQDAIGKIEFNPRDYYVVGPEAWPQAQQEHRGRIVALQKVYDELLALAMHCDARVE